MEIMHMQQAEDLDVRNSVNCKRRKVDQIYMRWGPKIWLHFIILVEYLLAGPFEKFMQVTMILPLTGQQYSEKVSENCVAIWKHLGIYTDEEGKAIDKFVSVFKDQTFPPGSSILFTVLPKGSLAVSNANLCNFIFSLLSFKIPLLQLSQNI